MNKTIKYLAVMFAAVITFASCDDTETYAEKRDKERAAINQYIADHNIKVISEAEFLKDSTTDVSKNEFVLFNSSGVYMQIVRKGCGEPIKNKETVTVLCRFDEYNIMNDTMQLSNNVLYYSTIVDKMTVHRSSGTYTGSFISGYSVMGNIYKSASVPGGWLIPFAYINVGRPQSANDEIAKVRLIVPYSQGQSNAVANVYPCYYELTFERGY